MRTGVSQSVVVGFAHLVLNEVSVRRQNLLLLQVGVEHGFNTIVYHSTNEQGSTEDN